MSGNLGVGNDIRKWTEEEKSTAKVLIHLYKSIRHIIQLGDQYRLRDPFGENRMAVQFVTRNGNESAVFTFQTIETEPMAAKGSSTSNRLVLHGLDPEGIYVIGGDIEKQEVSGAALMASGISISLRGNYSSKVIVLKKK